MNSKPAIIKHSKVKNTGILFEMLVRQITADALDGNPQSPALSLLRKYFHTDTELGKELQLYKEFFAASNLNENKAIRLVDLAVAQFKKLDHKKLAKEKYDLVKEIKAQYPLEDFLSSKIPSYKIYASIYKTFLTERKGSDSVILNIQEVASARFSLIEHLIGKQRKKTANPLEEEIQNFMKEPEEVRLLSHRLMINQFNKQYEGLLENQKTLLREYVANITNTPEFRTYVHKEAVSIKNSILTKVKTQNKVTQIKLKEVASQLDKIAACKMAGDREITALMIAYEIDNELGKSK